MQIKAIRFAPAFSLQTLNVFSKLCFAHSTVSQKALEGVVAKVEKLKKDCKIEPSKLVPTQLSILDSIPSPGKIISSKELPYAQAKEFILENGCKVTLYTSTRKVYILDEATSKINQIILLIQTKPVPSSHGLLRLHHSF